MFLTLCLVALQFSYIHLQVVEEGMGLNAGKVAYKVTTRMTWDSAHRYCESKNARLITPYLLDHTFLHKILFQGLAQGDAFWGGYRKAANGVFEWVRAYEEDSFPIVNGTVTSKKDCGALSYSGGNVTYTARDCYEHRPFICEQFAEKCGDPIVYGHNTDHLFYFKLDVKVTFTEALKYCAVFRAIPPTIGNQIENQRVAEYARTTLRSQHGYWLGAHRVEGWAGEDDWYWLDNQMTIYRNYWEGHKKTTAAEAGNRLVMWSNQARIADPAKTFATWAHQSETSKHGIICQKRCQ